VPKIKALCKLEPTPQPPAAAVRRMVTPPRPRPTTAERADIIAIGVSTGGPNALATLVGALPGDLPVPVVIVQHMPPMFTRLLAERLDAISPLRAAEAVPGGQLQPGMIWVAPGDRHMVVRGARGAAHIELNDGPPENSCRPAVDVLFRSVAEVYGSSAVGVVLTGMGHDGLRGCEHLAAAGAGILAQDQASSVVWGMPGAVVNAGLADRVLPLNDIPTALCARLRIGRSPAPSSRAVAR
jgi:two-component system, chemotaxis family, protein-glutamate methylesterase/glutaminase